jgi:hypothetical protein
MPDIINLPPASFIPEGEVSLPRLCTVLDAAAMDYERQPEEDDEKLYVRRGVMFPLWVRVDAEFRYIQLHSFVTIDDRITGQFEAANVLNEDASLLQFHIDGTRLYGYFWTSFAYGIDSRQFIHMLREFSEAFRAGAELLVAKVESQGTTEASALSH